MCVVLLVLLAALIVFLVLTSPHRSHFTPGVSCHQMCDLQFPGALADCDEQKTSGLGQCHRYKKCLQECNQEQLERNQVSQVPPGSMYARLSE